MSHPCRCRRWFVLVLGLLLPAVAGCGGMPTPAKAPMDEHGHADKMMGPEARDRGPQK